jgi:hypothetical protein
MFQGNALREFSKLVWGTATYSVEKFPLNNLCGEIWVLGFARGRIFDVDVLCDVVIHSPGPYTRNVAHKDPIRRPFASKVLVKISKAAWVQKVVNAWVLCSMECYLWHVWALT